MSDLETIELRVPAHVSDFIGQLSRDTGVSRDDVASVIAVLALRHYLAIPSAATADEAAAT